MVEINLLNDCEALEDIGREVREMVVGEFKSSKGSGGEGRDGVDLVGVEIQKIQMRKRSQFREREDGELAVFNNEAFESGETGCESAIPHNLKGAVPDVNLIESDVTEDAILQLLQSVVVRDIEPVEEGDGEGCCEYSP